MSIKTRLLKLERAAPANRKPVEIDIAGFRAMLYEGGPHIESPWPVPTLEEFVQACERYFQEPHEGPL